MPSRSDDTGTTAQGIRLGALLLGVHLATTAWALWAGVGLVEALIGDRGRETRALLGATGPLTEPWRWFSAPLLHGGLLHLGLNVASLWVLGRLAEGVLTPGPFWVAWALGGLSGAAASSAWGLVGSCGASGGVLALLSALVVASWRDPQVDPAERRLFVALLVGNLAIGLHPWVDGVAHLGGAVAGAFVGFRARG